MVDCRLKRNENKASCKKTFKGKKYTKAGFFTKRYEHWLQSSPYAFKKGRRR